jgi:hypothetical protein
MDKYIEQLLEMMLEAYSIRPESGKFADTDEGHFSEIEAFVKGGDERRVDQVMGISQDHFPPDEKLSDEQIERLVPAFIALWNHFRFDLCFSEKINTRWKYILMRRELAQEHMFAKLENSFVGIEFCHYDPEECPLPAEFCDCRDKEY